MDTQTLLIVGLAAGAAFLFMQQSQRQRTQSGGRTPREMAPEPSAGQVIGSTINDWFSWNGEIF